MTMLTSYIKDAMKEKLRRSKRSMNNIISYISSSKEDRRSFSVISDTTKYMDSVTKNLYENIPKYNRESDVQKLLDFIDKVDDYLEVARLDPDLELKLIPVKFSG